MPIVSYKDDFDSTIKIALQEIIVGFDKFRAQTLNELQKLLLEQIQKLAPRNTGEYAESWRLGSIDGNIATVETPMGLLYIILELQGRSPGRIHGDPLHFQIDGSDVFVRFVDHPGFDPIPHVRPALRIVLNFALSIIYENLRGNYRIFN